MAKIITITVLLCFACGNLFAAAAEAGEDFKGSAAPYIGIAAAFIGLGFAYHFYKAMMKKSEGSEKMIEIAESVRKGAHTYLSQQFKVVAAVFAVLFVFFIALAYLNIQNPLVPIAFVVGGFFSALCGYLGMKTATNASARTAQAATKSLDAGLQVSFRSGAVIGLTTVGVGLLYVSLWYLFLDKFIYTAANMKDGLTLLGLTLVPAGMEQGQKLFELTGTMVTFGIGASTQALFARVGGGIYTKAADVGADLVGKMESDIPEDDPRNPAVIADNVGDNVGDVAGMGADLYESYCSSILATCALGAVIPASEGISTLNAVTAPMAVAGFGIIISIAGIFMVRCEEEATQKNLLRSLLTGTLGSSLLILAAIAAMAAINWISWGIFAAAVSGLIAGVIIGQITEYYTSAEYKPTKSIASHSRMGPATAIIDGFSIGMFSTGLSAITIVVGIICAYAFAGGFSNVSMGLYGIGFAAVGMLSTLGITLAADAYGPIADNAGGNAEMSGLGKEVRERTDALDSLGNTNAATGKGFAIGSAALTAMALLAAYIESIRLWIGNVAADGVYVVGKTAFFRGSQADSSILEAFESVKTEGMILVGTADSHIAEIVQAYDLTIMNPKLICGLFIGAMMAFVFSAFTMKAVGRAAGDMVNEVRRQFKENPGILKGTEKPDYESCVAISTAEAQKQMIVPSLLAIAVPLITGLLLDTAGVLGLLAGALSTAFVLAISLNNAGGAWDNAKKFIEQGQYGGKGSNAHKAAIIGDTIGDPFKDTSGPSLNILIKLMTMVSVVFAGVVVRFAPVIGGWLGIN